MSAGTRYPPSRALPAQPSLRYLKLEAKRRLAAGEFARLHDAQAAIAREHGLPSWAGLKRACTPGGATQIGPALAHLRWFIERYSGAAEPGWTEPGQDELRRHFDDRFLAAVPGSVLAEQARAVAASLRGPLVVVRQAPLEAQVQLAGLRFMAAADADPPHRLTGLRGLPTGDRVADPRVKAPPPVRTAGPPPDEVVAIAARARAELGLAALAVAGGDPGRPPWTVTVGYADLDRAEPLQPGHLFPAPGVTGLVTGTAVLRLVAEGRAGLDDPANDHLRALRLADDSVTVRELLSHTGGVDSPAADDAGQVPDLTALTGPVVSCDGPRGAVWPSNGGYAVLGQLVADITGLSYARAATRLVLEPLGLRDSRFPATAGAIPRGSGRHPRSEQGAVTGYTVTADGAFEATPSRVPVLQAIAGLWTTGADLVRLGTGWPSLLPAPLVREALSPQAGPGPGGLRVGLGPFLEGETTWSGGASLDAVALLRTRVRDRRTYAVLTSRMMTLESLDRELRRAWLTGRPS